MLDGADPALRKMVVEMLYSDQEIHPLLDNPLTLSAPPEGLFREGDCAGRYRIVREIGSGGMGSVYLAELADQVSGPRFALKVVRFPSQELSRRFAEESRILSRLEHPNIARLLDAGTASNGLPFLVMEYVDGKSIHQYCKEKQLTPTDCARLFRQVCAGVRYLHQNLVVHRDLKPANILITGDGSVKVVDFGIAKLIGQAGALNTGETQSMTPEYASPEQVRSEPISTLSDVFSLGVLLYEILSGGKPFEGNALEVLRKVCEEDPVKPSLKNRAIPADLDSIVLQAMNKAPERRYASVEQLDEDLRRHLVGLPVAARGDSMTYRASKFAARNKTVLGAVAAVMLALGGGIVTTKREARHAQSESLRAESHRAVAESHRERADNERQRAESQTHQAIEQRERAERSESEAVGHRQEAERRLKELEKVARGAVRAYEAANGANTEPGRNEFVTLLAENARDSMLALGREGLHNAIDLRLMDVATAQLRSREQTVSPEWQVPTGWSAAADDPKSYRVGVDRQVQYQGKPSVFLGALVPEPNGVVALTQQFDAKQYQGKRVRLSAVLRAENVVQAALSLRQTSGAEISGDVSSLSGSHSWKLYAVVIDVPESANTLSFSVRLKGTGKVWSSNFDFHEVAKSVPLTERQAPLNLSFTNK